jgi:hypothetical protein
MTEREVTRWIRDVHRSPATERERRLRLRLEDLLGHDVAVEFEDVVAERVVEAEECLLLFVGSVLMQRSRHVLWSRIYSVVTDDDTAGAADRFLENGTVAARRGEF